LRDTSAILSCHDFGLFCREIAAPHDEQFCANDSDPWRDHTHHDRNGKGVRRIIKNRKNEIAPSV
jgi:hypothetical protein